jgi:2-hydroxychromene-2-carboxylate isomerase
MEFPRRCRRRIPETAYRRWLQLGQETGSEPNISHSLHDIGQEAERVLALADSTETRGSLAGETDTARELGVFGSPTFAIGRELFWGDDRLEDAISWYRQGSFAYLLLTGSW